MKNTPVSILACACLMLAAFLGGMYLGRNISGGSIQTSVLSTQVATPPTQSTAASAASSIPASVSHGTDKVNINTADIYELMRLEGIGEVYAQRIIDYRTANGPFTSIEDIKNVTGIGEKRFEAIKDSITVGG